LTARGDATRAGSPCSGLRWRRLIRGARVGLPSHGCDTRLLYEEGPHRQGHDSLVVTSALTSVTVRRIVDGIEQRSSLYGLLREGQGHVGGCSGGPIPSRVVKRPEASWGLPGQTVHS